MKIRKATKKDLKEIAEIYAEEFSKPPYNEPWNLKKARNKINIYTKYCKIWKVILGKEIVGFIIINETQWFPGKVAFAEEFAIKKDFQGKGIGTSILKKVIQMYKQKGFEKFMCFASRKSKALKLYKKLGITEGGGVLLRKKLK